MKYVKLVALPNTWFKEGTEVYAYNAKYCDKNRVTLEEWNKAVDGPFRAICVRGIRICDSEYEAQSVNVGIGDERIDGELCSVDEFWVEVIDDSEKHEKD